MTTVNVLGTTVWNTTAGDKSLAATPGAVGLIIIIAPATGVATSAVSDNNADGRGTYTKIGSSFTGFSTGGDLSMWVRNALIPTTATTFSVTQTGSTGGGLIVLSINSVASSIVGLGAIRGAGGQSSGTAGTTPAPVLLGRTPSGGGYIFSGTQAGLTGNVMIGAVCNGTNGATTVTPPASWAEHFDNGYNVPATGFEACSRASGNTASTITFGSTTATTFASMVIEVDMSIPQYDWVVPGKPDRDREIFLQGDVGRRSTWMQGLRREWTRAKSGILVPELGF